MGLGPISIKKKNDDSNEDSTFFLKPIKKIFDTS